MGREVVVMESVLGANEVVAGENRARLDAAGVFGLNLMASPGAGKTSLIEHTIKGLAGQTQMAVIDGDVASSIDADRAAAAGARAVQINTGGGCHLDAPMVRQGLDQLALEDVQVLIVENVGNLICPANFQLGMHRRVLVASIPEGDDKPYKYPGMYCGVDVLVINKVDLLPYIEFDMARFCRGVQALNPGLVTFPVSCRTGEGLEAWLWWIEVQMEAKRDASLHSA